MKVEELFSVRGKVALVTGGSRGIGEMIARGYVENGAKVYITARKADACDALARELSRIGECISIPADLSAMDEIERLAGEMQRREKRLDILVNNAGATWGASFEDFPESGWDKIMDLNVKSVFFLEQPLRKEEHRFDVEVHDLVPSRLREVFEAGAPGGSCIVDENIQPFLATLHFPGQPLDLIHSRQIRRYGDALPDARQLSGERIARIRLARRDVDLGAVLDIAASDHFADAATSAGDQRDLAAHAEQLLDLHRPSPWFPLRAGNLFRMLRRRATRPAPRLHLATRRFHRSADARRKTRRNAGSCRSTQRRREFSYFFSTLPRISSKLCCIRS